MLFLSLDIFSNCSFLFFTITVELLSMFQIRNIPPPPPPFLHPSSRAREAERCDASRRVVGRRTRRRGGAGCQHRRRPREGRGGERHSGKAEPRRHVRLGGRTQTHGPQLLAQRPLRNRWGHMLVIQDRWSNTSTCEPFTVFFPVKYKNTCFLWSPETWLRICKWDILFSVYCCSFLLWLTDSEQTYICGLMQLMK